MPENINKVLEIERLGHDKIIMTGPTKSGYDQTEIYDNPIDLLIDIYLSLGFVLTNDMVEQLARMRKYCEEEISEEELELENLINEKIDEINEVLFGSMEDDN